MGDDHVEQICDETQRILDGGGGLEETIGAIWGLSLQSPDAVQRAAIRCERRASQDPSWSRVARLLRHCLSTGLFATDRIHAYGSSDAVERRADRDDDTVDLRDIDAEPLDEGCPGATGSDPSGSLHVDERAMSVDERPPNG